MLSSPARAPPPADRSPSHLCFVTIGWKLAGSTFQSRIHHIVAPIGSSLSLLLGPNSTVLSLLNRFQSFPRPLPRPPLLDSSVLPAGGRGAFGHVAISAVDRPLRAAKRPRRRAAARARGWRACLAVRLPPRRRIQVPSTIPPPPLRLPVCFSHSPLTAPLPPATPFRFLVSPVAMVLPAGHRSPAVGAFLAAPPAPGAALSTAAARRWRPPAAAGGGRCACPSRRPAAGDSLWGHPRVATMRLAHGGCDADAASTAAAAATSTAAAAAAAAAAATPVVPVAAPNAAAASPSPVRAMVAAAFAAAALAFGSPGPPPPARRRRPSPGLAATAMPAAMSAPRPLPSSPSRARRWCCGSSRRGGRTPRRRPLASSRPSVSASRGRRRRVPSARSGWRWRSWTRTRTRRGRGGGRCVGRPWRGGPAVGAAQAGGGDG